MVSNSSWLTGVSRLTAQVLAIRLSRQAFGLLFRLSLHLSFVFVFALGDGGDARECVRDQRHKRDAMQQRR